MAYTTAKNTLVLGFRDERQQLRNRTIELGGLVVITDDDATEWSAISKSIVRTYKAGNKQVDQSLVAAVGSEVKDTARLFFLLDDDTQAHLDIVDPMDSLFLATSGAGALVVKPYDTLAAEVTPEAVALVSIIDKVLAGSILISDGEQPVSYVDGARI